MPRRARTGPTKGLHTATAGAAAAITVQAALTGGESPTEAEFNLLRGNVAAIAAALVAAGIVSA